MSAGIFMPRSTCLAVCTVLQVFICAVVCAPFEIGNLERLSSENIQRRHRGLHIAYRSLVQRSRDHRIPVNSGTSRHHLSTGKRSSLRDWTNACDGGDGIVIEGPIGSFQEAESSIGLQQKISQIRLALSIAYAEVKDLQDIYREERFSSMSRDDIELILNSLPPEMVIGPLENLQDLQNKYNELSESDSGALVLAAYADLSRVAVFLREAVLYLETQGSATDNIQRATAALFNTQLVDTLLCHMEVTIQLLGDSRAQELVNRNIIPVHLRNEHTASNVTLAHLRDYILLKDFENLLIILDKQFGDVIENT